MRKLFRKLFRFLKKMIKKLFKSKGSSKKKNWRKGKRPSSYGKPITYRESSYYDEEEFEQTSSNWCAYNSPEARGEMGERTVIKALGNDVEGRHYLINDLIIADGDQTSQLDHVYINENGIWVIETKNYSGMIYGKEQNESWKQVLAYGHEKHSFYNPVKQNNTHIYRLGKLLNPPIKLHGIVVFASLDADLSNVSARGICYAHMLPRYVAQKTGVTLTAEQIIHYKNCIQELKDKNVVSLREHVENINKMQSGLKNDICPRCGGLLKTFNGQNGQFKGCSNYPKCTFTLKSR